MDPPHGLWCVDARTVVLASIVLQCVWHVVSLISCAVAFGLLVYSCTSIANCIAFASTWMLIGGMISFLLSICTAVCAFCSETFHDKGWCWYLEQMFKKARDYAFFIAWMFAIISIAELVVMGSGALSSFSSSSLVEDVPLASVSIAAALVLIDVLVVHHRSRGGVNILLPNSLLLCIASLVMYLVIGLSFSILWNPTVRHSWWKMAVMIVWCLTKSGVGLSGFFACRIVSMIRTPIITTVLGFIHRMRGSVTLHSNLLFCDPDTQCVLENIVIAHSPWTPTKLLNMGLCRNVELSLDVWVPGKSITSQQVKQSLYDEDEDVYHRKYDGTLDSSRARDVEDATTKGLPVVVLAHGGGYRMGDKSHVQNVGWCWAMRGYVVVAPNYRLAPEMRYPIFVQDIAKAVRWTFLNIERYGGDPSSIFLAGHSAGAHAAALLALHPDLLREEGISPGQLAGVLVMSAFRIRPYHYGLIDGFVWNVSRCGMFEHKDASTCTGRPDPRVVLDASPLHHAHNMMEQLRGEEVENDRTDDIPPMLLLHGSDENRVIAKSTVELYHSLIDVKGRDGAVLISVPGETHISEITRVGLPGREDVLSNEVVAWMDRVRHSAASSISGGNNLFKSIMRKKGSFVCMHQTA